MCHMFEHSPSTPASYLPNFLVNFNLSFKTDLQCDFLPEIISTPSTVSDVWFCSSIAPSTHFTLALRTVGWSWIFHCVSSPCDPERARTSPGISELSSPVFPNSSDTDISGQKTPWSGGCPAHCRMRSITPGLHPLNASGTSSSVRWQKPSLETSQHPLGEKVSLDENHSSGPNREPDIYQVLNTYLSS